MPRDGLENSEAHIVAKRNRQKGEGKIISTFRILPRAEMAVSLLNVVLVASSLPSLVDHREGNLPMYYTLVSKRNVREAISAPLTALVDRGSVSIGINLSHIILGSRVFFIYLEKHNIISPTSHIHKMSSSWVKTYAGT